MEKGSHKVVNMDVKSKSDIILRKKIKKNAVAIIPVGAIEQHGPHLPVSTDSDIITEISRQISERNDYLLMPTITCGVSFEHSPYFNLSIRKSTLQNVITDLCLSLQSNGISTVFIMNGHHGNLSALKGLEKKIKNVTKRKFNVFVFSYWHFMKKELGHAGFVETSLMLAISKDVKMKFAKKGIVTEGMSKNEIRKISKLAEKSFPKATKNGIWGDPTNATKKDGKKILAEIVKNLQKKCQTCLTGKESMFHQ